MCTVQKLGCVAASLSRVCLGRKLPFVSGRSANSKPVKSPVILMVSITRVPINIYIYSSYMQLNNKAPIVIGLA